MSASKRMVASALPRNVTSSERSMKRSSILVAPISTNIILSSLVEHGLGLPHSYGRRPP
jgi:hypothetical protein